MDTPKTLDSARTDLANIGKSVVIKGELSGSEDLYLDGQVEGSIEMAGNRLTIGPNGKVKANVTARSAVVQGRLGGQCASQRSCRSKAISHCSRRHCHAADFHRRGRLLQGRSRHPARSVQDST